MQDNATESTAVATKSKPDNRWRRGLRHGLRTRRLPFKGGRAIELYRNEYRKAIENELLQQGREIGPTEASIICAATLGFEHSLKAGRWLADNHDTLDPEVRLAFSREELRGMSEAARLLKTLGIDRNPSARDMWASLEHVTFDPDSAPNAEPAPIKDETNAT